MSSSAPTPGEEPVLDALAEVGLRPRSLSELRHSRTRYRDAIPVLIHWLTRVDDAKVKEEIVRALSVPWAKPAATKPLIEEFRSHDLPLDSSTSGLRWVVGSALEVVFDDDAYDSFVELSKDRSYGKARQMVVLGLGKSKRPEAVDVLLSLTNDPDVDGHAIKALGKLKSPAARPALEAALTNTRAWVRSEARRALAKLNR